ncbi:PTS system, fructose-specific IIB component / PTS system, fructose-specific IIC component [Klebsiella pneumoniae IS46]|nr:PTS system, fructose-specific IIB component / PTS system, fructose-specific IIC component [Klebsiella pneumoniae IS46]
MVKNVYLGDINRAVAHPELFLGEAKDHAKPYVAPAAVAVPAAAQGQKRIVAVTACRPASPTPLWRQKPSKPKPKKNAAGG